MCHTKGLLLVHAFDAVYYRRGHTQQFEQI